MDNSPIVLSDPNGDCTNCTEEEEAKNNSTKDGKTPDGDIFTDKYGQKYKFDKDLNAWLPSEREDPKIPSESEYTQKEGCRFGE